MPVFHEADRLCFRPLDAADRGGIATLFEHLSPQSRYLRYFSPMTQLPEATLTHLAAVDHDQHEAVGAFLGSELVGVAHAFRSPRDPTEAEIAVEVADEHQHHGVGVRLVAELAALARDEGIARFTATMLGSNRAVQSMVQRSSWPASLTVAGGEIEMTLQLPVAAAAARGGTQPGASD